MVRECKPPARAPTRSWLVRRSTMATSTPANASSPPTSDLSDLLPRSPPHARSSSPSRRHHAGRDRRHRKSHHWFDITSRLIGRQRSHVAPSLPESSDSTPPPGVCHKPPSALYPGSSKEGVLLPFRLSAVDGQALCEAAARGTPGTVGPGRSPVHSEKTRVTTSCALRPFAIHLYSIIRSIVRRGFVSLRLSVLRYGLSAL
jgi:hypothetical protein